MALAGLDSTGHSEYSGSSNSTYSLEFFNQVVIPRNVDNDIAPGTQVTYHTIWKGFLNFLRGFDQLPERYEDKMVLFAAFLADTMHKPATIASYMSAIRYKLVHDGYPLNDDKAKLASIVRTSKLKNNRVHNRMPVNRRMLRDLLDAVNIRYDDQPYLRAMYRCLFMLAYYGLLRIGELTKGTHLILAQDVHMSNNWKRKIQLVLRSSKTHGRGDRPQIITIPNKVDEAEIYALQGTKYCPFAILQEYLIVRGNYKQDSDQFFVFSDASAVKDSQFRTVIKATVKLAGYQNKIYSAHSFRAGRADDLRNDGIELCTIQKIGRWKSEGSLLCYFQ